ALAAVFERACATAGVRVAEAAEPVLVRAEEVRVDRADADALLLRVLAERAVVVRRVPGDVQRDRGAAAGQAVDERRVREPLVHGARGARPGVDVEARAGVPVAPRRRLDLQATKLLERALFVHGWRVCTIQGRFTK